jgi:hypothetical protein
MSLFLAADYTMDKLHQVVVRDATMHQSRADHDPELKKASSDLAIAADPDAAAVATEWLRDGRDDTDLTGTIFEHITPRSFTAFVGYLDKVEILSHTAQNFAHCNHHVGGPCAILSERHELDEAHHNAFFTRELAARNGPPVRLIRSMRSSSGWASCTVPSIATLSTFFPLYSS